MPKVNVYCSDKGWLFEDLKREIAKCGAIPSTVPLKKADAWICIRTKEAHLSPDPARTVLQVHDCKSQPLEGFGHISFVHPAAKDSWPDLTGHFDVIPIGSRDIPYAELPSFPTLGFFCREDRGQKRSEMFREAVLKAKPHTPFRVLMIGERLGHIQDIGIWLNRAATPADYPDIDALVTCSKSPMIPLSMYEAIAAGRTVITTPRIWPARETRAIKTADTVEDLSKIIVETMKWRVQHAPYKPFSRTDWAKHQYETACSVAR